VVITASHNPKEYNGYKAYWQGGAQLVPPHDKNVITEVNAIGGFENIKFQADPSKIKTIGKEVEDAYYEEVNRLIPQKRKYKTTGKHRIGLFQHSWCRHNHGARMFKATWVYQSESSGRATRAKWRFSYRTLP
jgi:hypothetical protein